MAFRSNIATAKRLSGYATPPKQVILSGTAPEGTPTKSIVGDGDLTYGVAMVFSHVSNPQLQSDVVRNRDEVVPVGCTVTVVANADGGDAAVTEVTISEPGWEDFQRAAEIKLRQRATRVVYDAKAVGGSIENGLNETRIGDGNTRYGNNITLDQIDLDGSQKVVKADEVIASGVVVTYKDTRAEILHPDLLDTLTHAENLLLASMMTPAVGTDTVGDGFNATREGTQDEYQKENESFSSVQQRKNELQAEYESFVRLAMQMYELMTPTVQENFSLPEILI